MQVHSHGHAFGFGPTPGTEFAGRLVLEDEQRALLAAGDECWYPGDGGERLPAEELFARSPWSRPGPAGPVELRCRWADLRDGAARFNTPDLYLGEFFRWTALQTPNHVACCQGAFFDALAGSNGVRLLSTPWAIISNFRMHAPTAAIFGLPAATSRS